MAFNQFMIQCATTRLFLPLPLVGFALDFLAAAFFFISCDLLGTATADRTFLFFETSSVY